MSGALCILGAGLSADFESARVRPEFRRATRGMVLAATAVEDALRGFGEAPPASLALVLGSGYGELDITRDFLGTFAASGLARPLLFQSSLHNATTGFLALHFGIRGPTMTVSNRFFTGETALDTAQTLIESGLAELCLAVSFEARVPVLHEGLRDAYAPEIELGEGAAAVLLTNSGSAFLREKKPPATLEALRFPFSGKAPLAGKFYDSDAIEHLVRAVRAGEPGEFALAKPDGRRSLFRVAF